MRATRRDFMRKAGLAGSLITIPAVAGVITGDRAEAGMCAVAPTIAHLIEAHRKAYAALQAASDEVDAAEDRKRRAPDIFAAATVHPDGKQGGGRFDVEQIEPARIREEIDAFHDKLVNCPEARWLAAAAQHLMSGRAEAIEAARQRAHAALERAVQAAQEREIAFGIPAAWEAFDAASQAEWQARVAVAVQRPRDASEARAKADYFASTDAFEEFTAEPGAFGLLLATLCTVAEPGRP